MDAPSLRYGHPPHPLPINLPSFGGYASAGHAEFSVYAVADSLRVRLIHPGTRSLVVRDLERSDHPALWSARVAGDFRGWTYTYELTRGGHSEGCVLDPHAALVSDGRCVLVDDQTPVAPAPPLSHERAVIYELHVRDFTNHPTSGVRPEWRGTYPGLAESGTECPAEWGGSISTGIDHLRELGVTVVQLMPIHAFAYIHHNRYDWGYMPEVFTSPHEPYASATDLHAPVRELKQLVSALHEAGMRVTLDMVFNHTCEKWPSKRRSFMCLAPQQYFRHNEDGSPADGSACGNEIASEHPVMRDLIVTACTRWVREYGIDGFRFDLMGLMDLETIDRLVHAVRQEKPDALLYGEPWAASHSPARITHKGDQRSRGFAVFNDDFRDAARGDVFNNDSSGFLTHGTQRDRIKRAVRGSVETFADSPLESINFIEVHDNHTLADRVSLHIPSSDGQARLHALMLGAYYLLTSAGIPLVHAGQEFGRHRSMIDNAYDQADAINNIDWSHKQRRIDLADLYRTLIALRLEHPILRLATRAHVTECLKFLDEDLGIHLPEGVVAWQVERPEGIEDTWQRACVVLNASRDDHSIPLPDHGCDWLVNIIGFTPAPEDGSRATDNKLDVPAMSGAIVYQCC